MILVENDLIKNGNYTKKDVDEMSFYRKMCNMLSLQVLKNEDKINFFLKNVELDDKKNLRKEIEKMEKYNYFLIHESDYETDNDSNPYGLGKGWGSLG